MDTPAPADERSPLADETWHSAVLLAATLGSMGLLAALLLAVTTWLAG